MTSHFLGCLCMGGGEGGEHREGEETGSSVPSPHLGKRSRDEMGVGP